MLIGIVTGPNLSDALIQLEKGNALAQAFEIRLDLFQKIDINEINILKKSSSKPLIFAIRKVSDRGKYNKSENERLLMIEQLLNLGCDYFDVEEDMPTSFFEKIKQKFPNTKWIVSCHANKNVKIDVDAVVQRMQKKKADHYKIVADVNSTLEIIDFILLANIFLKSFSFLPLGKKAVFGRILALFTKASLHYFIIEGQKLEGQIGLDEIKLYRLNQIDEKTTIYGLIGDGERSFGHIVHNKIYDRLGINSIYLKMPIIDKDDLPSFFSKLSSFPIMGLSVTMPLKKEMKEYCSFTSSSVINTLSKKDDNIWCGDNTDGIAAYLVLEKKQKDLKNIAIIGTGGAAEEIGRVCIEKKIKVNFFGRRKCEAFPFFSLPLFELSNFSYDVLINTIPDVIERNIISPSMILENKIVMDIITLPKETKLLAIAKQKSNKIIYGYEMYLYQAYFQMKKWFSLEKAYLECMNGINIDQEIY